MVGSPDPPRGARVTRREAEVLAALGARLTNAEIAERLCVSVRTVESHVSSLLHKLGVADRRQLSALAGASGQPRRSSWPPPLPSALADLVAGGPFVGRDSECAALRDSLDKVRRSVRRGLVLVTGEAGIGKTRLVSEFAAAVHAQGVTIGYGRCEEEVLVPYQPFVEAVDALAGHLPAALAERVAPDLAPLLPGGRLPAAPPGGPPSTDGADLARHRLFEAFDAAVSIPAAVVTLVIDDLHRADRSTILLLRHVLRRRDRSPLLVLATARREGMTPGSRLADLMVEVERDQEVVEVRLGGLDVEHVAALVAALVPGRPAARAVAEVTWSRTGGNPFLVQQLLRHLDESGDPVDSVDSFDPVVPPQVREVVARRVARLGPGLVEVLTAGAVAGESFRLTLACRAVGRAPEHLLDPVDTAVAAGVVAELPGQPDHYRFTHALVRDALDQRLTTSRRAYLHVRVAEELERLDRAGHLAEVAHHRHAGLPTGNPVLAARAASEAAAQALRLLGYEEAGDFATMALDAIDAGGGGETDRFDVLLIRGDARLRAGDEDGARADFRAAVMIAGRIGDAVRLARGALGLGDASAVWGEDPELIVALEAAVAALPDGEFTLRARVRARLAQALYYTGPPTRRQALSDDAVREAMASGDSQTLAWVLSARHAALWAPADLDARVEAGEEIVHLAGRLGDEELEVRGLGWLVTDRLERGDVAGCDAALARHAELAARLRQPTHRRDAETWAAMRAMLAGRLDEAERAVERARELGEAAHDPHAETAWWIQRYWIAGERQDVGALDRLVGPYQELADRHTQVPAWRAALAMLHCRRADAPAAREQFQRLARDRFAGLPRDVVYLNALTYLAETCHFLGDVEAARVLLALLEPFTGRFAVIDRALACKGSVDRHCGLLAATLGDRDQAAARLRAALRQHEGVGAVLLAARTRRELDAVTSAGS